MKRACLSDLEGTFDLLISPDYIFAVGDVKPHVLHENMRALATGGFASAQISADVSAPL